MTTSEARSPFHAVLAGAFRRFRSSGRAAALAAGLLLAAGCASDSGPAGQWHAMLEPAYDYPYDNPWVATILGTPPQMRAEFPGEVRPERHRLVLFEGRERPEGFWYHDGLYYSTLLQPRRAPLVFVIAGTGADDRAAKMLTLGRILHAAGMHVVLLPSPSHANFIVSAGSNFRPGQPAMDAADLLNVIQRVHRRIAGRVEISDLHLTGYSLGAWHAAFTAKLDEERGDLGFKRVLLINPPVSLYRSIQRLDGMLLSGLQNGIDDLARFLDQAVARLSAVYRNTDALDFGFDSFLTKAYEELQPTDDRLATTIGLTFRLSSSNMIFASDVMSRAGYIFPRDRSFESTTPLSEYLAVALRTSFIDYFNDLYTEAYLAGSPSGDVRGLIEGSSLSSIGDWLRRRDNVGLLTSADDVILAPGDLEELRRIFGSRARIYRNGGHVGNLEHRAVAAHIANFFGP